MCLSIDTPLGRGGWRLWRLHFSLLSPRWIIAKLTELVRTELGLQCKLNPLGCKFLQMCFCVITEALVPRALHPLQFQISISYKSQASASDSQQAPIRTEKLTSAFLSHVFSRADTRVKTGKSDPDPMGPRDIWLFKRISVRHEMCRLDTNVYFLMRPQSRRRWEIIL